MGPVSSVPYLWGGAGIGLLATTPQMFNIVRGEAAPDSELLASVDRIFSTQDSDWAICTQRLGRLDCLFSDFPVWDVFGEEHVGNILAGDTARAIDGEQ